MTQITRSDWLPKRARWSHLARLGLPTVFHKKNFPESHIINPLLTKFVRSRWLDIGFVSVHKHAKKELGQYPAILASHLVNNPHFLLFDSSTERSISRCLGKIPWLHLSPFITTFHSHSFFPSFNAGLSE